MEESPSSSHLSCLTTHARSADYHAKLAEVEDNLRKAREARAMQVLAVLFALLPGVGPHTIHATALPALSTGKPRSMAPAAPWTRAERGFRAQCGADIRACSQKERILEKHASMKSMTADILEADILSATPARKQTDGTGKTVAATVVPEPPLAAASDSQRQHIPGAEAPASSTAPYQVQEQLLPQAPGQNTSAPLPMSSVSPPPPTQAVGQGLAVDAPPIAAGPPPTIDRGIIAPAPPVESDQPTNQTADREVADAAPPIVSDPPLASEPSKETAAMPPQPQQIETAVAAPATLPVATSTPELGEESVAPKQSQPQGGNEAAVVTAELFSVSPVDVKLKLQLDMAEAGEEGSVLRAAFEKGLKRDLAIASRNRDICFETKGVYAGETSIEVDVQILPDASGAASQLPAEIAQFLVSNARDHNSQLRNGVYTSALESVEIIDSTRPQKVRMNTPRRVGSIKTRSGSIVKSIADTLDAAGVAGANRGRPGLLFYPNAECCLVVNDAIVGTHAVESGIEIGDVIVKVEGQSVEGHPMDVVMEMFAGSIGSNMTVTVRKHHSDKKLRFTLLRDVPYASPHPSAVELPRTLSRSLSLSRPGKGALNSPKLQTGSPVEDRSKTTPTVGSQGRVLPKVDSELDDPALEQLKLEQEAAEWAAKHALEHEDLRPEDVMHAKTPSGDNPRSHASKARGGPLVDQLGGPLPQTPRTARGESLASPRSEIASQPGTPRDSDTTDATGQKKVWGIKRALSRVSSKLLSPRG